MWMNIMDITEENLASLLVCDRACSLARWVWKLCSILSMWNTDFSNQSWSMLYFCNILSFTHNKHHLIYALYNMIIFFYSNRFPMVSNYSRLLCSPVLRERCVTRLNTAAGETAITVIMISICQSAIEFYLHKSDN